MYGVNLLNYFFHALSVNLGEKAEGRKGRKGRSKSYMRHWPNHENISFIAWHGMALYYWPSEWERKY